MPAIHRLTDFQARLLKRLGVGDGIPVDEAGTDKDGFEAKAFQMPAEVLVREDAVPVLRVCKCTAVIFEAPLREEFLL